MPANQAVNQDNLSEPNTGAIEDWLHGQVGPAYDALKADPSRAITTDQVRKKLAAEHKTTIVKASCGNSN